MSRALRVKHELFDVPDVKARGLFDEIVEETRRKLSKGDLADAMLVLGRNLGSWGVIEPYEAYRKGELSDVELLARVKGLHAEILAQADEGEASLQPTAQLSASLDDAAQALREQLEQRFALLGSRIEHEQKSFSREIDDIVHDAGNALERAMQDRLMTDDWRKTQVWESIGRMDFAREAEHRIDRVLRQREEGLRLLHDELRLFHGQITFAQRINFDRAHHSRYEGLMPPLELSARMLHRLDELAKVTLGTGAAAAAGAGTAAYYLGVATVFTAMAPALPYVGGALLAAGIVKWLMPPDERRKYAQIRDKREAFERVIRDKLGEAQVAHTAELQRIYDAFCQSAPALLAPITLEAEALRQLPAMRKKLVRGAVTRSRDAVKQLQRDIHAVRV